MTRNRIATATAIAVLVCGPALAGGLRGTVSVAGGRVGDAVVYFDAIDGVTFEAPEVPVAMNQKDMVFRPHVLPVLAGTTVEFHNSDDVLHNVFSPMKCAGQFNLGMWGKGESKAYTFAEAGCSAVLLCSVHPEMEAYVVALPTPYFASPDTAGMYAIDGVPPGTYTVEVWHPKQKKATPANVQVTVAKESAVQADFALRK